MIDDLMSQLQTSNGLGSPYLEDALRAGVARPAALAVRTRLADPANYGRGKHGWYVKGGLPDSYTFAELQQAPLLGNRSVFAKLSFCSTQRGVAEGSHGMFEMLLSPGSTAADIRAKVRAGNGVFYISDMDDNAVIAGSDTERVFRQSAGTVYTMAVLLYRKGVFASLSGADVPEHSIRLNIPDRERFIPGLPGFAIHPNEHAEGGEAYVFDWTVSPAGPYRCQLGAIGDSITAGLDGEPEEESYVYQVTRALGQQQVLNVGSGGSTTALDLARFPYEISPFRPNVVWIEGGTNDIGAGVSAETIFDNMLAQAKSVHWGGKVVLSTVPPRTLRHDAQYDQLFQLNRMIRSCGLPVVDRYRIVRDERDPRRVDPKFRCRDGVHINAAGHERIAAEAMKVLKSLG